MEHSKGFTLIELMIAVAIVAIIGMVAYPSYLEHVRETRRANATLALMSLAGQMERYYTENNSYAGAALGALPAALHSPVDAAPADAEYVLRITYADVERYTIEAQRTGVQAADDCGDFVLTQTGARTIINQAAGLTARNCW